MQRLDLTARRLQHPRQRIEFGGRNLTSLVTRLDRAMRVNLERLERRVAHATSRLTSRNPVDRVAGYQLRLKQLDTQIAESGRRLVESRRTKLDAAADRLRAIGPAQTLARGYAIVTLPAGGVVRDASQCDAGDQVTARLAKGRLDCEVLRVEPADDRSD